MDDVRFDALVKALGAQRSRRGVLGALAGAALAAVGFGNTAEARRCRSVGNICAANGDCCSGFCGVEGPTRKTCHCTADRDCPGGVCLNEVCCLPDPQPVTCANQCGAQPNNCQQSVDCGACCVEPDGACGANGECCSRVCVNGVCLTGQVYNGEACDDDGDCLAGHCENVICACPVITSSEGPKCFWENCFDAPCCWTPNGFHAPTRLACQRLDSCAEGGGNGSHGGCYKWALSSDTQIAPPW